MVAVDLSPFGRSGPYAGWRGSDLAVWAMGGYLQVTGAPDREPLWVPGSQAELHAGAQAAFAALVGLYEQRRSGWGQAVEVSALEATLSAHAWLVSSWAACGVAQTRQPSDLLRAADGWVYFMQIVPNDDLFVLIERPDLYDEHLASDLLRWYANVPRIFEAVASWAAEHPVDEIVETAQALRLAVTPVLDAAGVAGDVQLAAREWWESDGAAATGAPIAFPGQPYHLSATPSRRRGPAPEPGSAEVGLEPRPSPVGAPPSGPPLSGLRVIEVTNNWAGPLCGRFLADLGADVVKIERPSRPATRALFWPGPGAQDRQRQGHHRAMYFNELNRNKRDLALDLAEPAGREAFLDLVAGADVVIENNSARVMPNLGLDWEVLHARNPRLVMVSMSGYGADGPRRDWVAYGSNIETTSGLTSTTGYPDGQLSRTTLFYADPVSGIHGAVAVMAALGARPPQRRGPVDRDVPQRVRCRLLLRGPAASCGRRCAVRRPAPTGTRASPPTASTPAPGADLWVAIAVQSDEEWPRLAALLGRPDLAGDPALATLAGRHARHDELDTAIAAWTSRSRAVRGGLGAAAGRRLGRSGACQLAGPARSAPPSPRLLPAPRAPCRRRLPDHHLAVALRPHPGAAGEPGAAVRGAQPPDPAGSGLRRGPHRGALCRRRDRRRAAGVSFGPGGLRRGPQHRHGGHDERGDEHGAPAAPGRRRARPTRRTRRRRPGSRSRPGAPAHPARRSGGGRRRARRGW